MEDRDMSTSNLGQSQRPTLSIKERRLRNGVRVICWMTLYVDACLLLGCITTGWFGNGNPHAQIEIGGLQVSSLMPGGTGFISFISVWTGVLSYACLWFERKSRIVSGVYISLNRSRSS
jgi:hypothetical protein